MKRTIDEWDGCCPECGDTWPESDDRDYDTGSEGYWCTKCEISFYVHLLRYEPVVEPKTIPKVAPGTMYTLTHHFRKHFPTIDLLGVYSSLELAQAAPIEKIKLAAGVYDSELWDIVNEGECDYTIYDDSGDSWQLFTINRITVDTLQEK